MHRTSAEWIVATSTCESRATRDSDPTLRQMSPCNVRGLLGDRARGWHVTGPALDPQTRSLPAAITRAWTPGVARDTGRRGGRRGRRLGVPRPARALPARARRRVLRRDRQAAAGEQAFDHDCGGTRSDRAGRWLPRSWPWWWFPVSRPRWIHPRWVDPDPPATGRRIRDHVAHDPACRQVDPS